MQRRNSVIRVLAVLLLIALVAAGCRQPFSAQVVREKHIITDKLTVQQGGARFDGGLVDVGIGSAGTADGNDDLLVAGDLEVDDTIDCDGNIDLDGDGFDVDITGGYSIDGDAASNVTVGGAGIDLTLESEARSVVVKGDEAVATAVTLDANDAVTTGITIQVGSVGGLNIGGGLTDIGAGSYSTADGDNDLGVAGDLEVDGELELDGALDADSTANIQGLLTLQAGLTSSDGDVVVADDLRVTAQTVITVTNGAAFTATGTYQGILSAEEVTPTLAAGAEGDLLVLINKGSNTINLADSGTQKLSAAVALGPDDSLTLWSDGTNWIETCRSDN